jgi:glycosyltransferase involved in cell wall biosynthesis
MKLIIQIPCFDEEEQLPAMLAELPRRLEGIDTVEWLIVDDGSGDRTIEVARAHGVDHIVRLTNNKGLATAFQAGLDACLKLGADIVVNTDADNQYDARDIPKLIEPILAGTADMVVGDREVAKIEHFSTLKVRLQHLGSAVVRRASETTVPDTTSGFRAYNREAALQMATVSKFTYTLETIIQAGKMLVAVDHVPVGTNPKTRESRLFPSMWAYVRRNGMSIFRIYALYEPLRVFMTLAAIVGLAALVIFARYLWFYLAGEGAGHVQSLILGSMLFIAAVQLAALGVIGDVLAGSRVLQQRVLERVRRVELELGVAPSHYEPGAPRAADERVPADGSADTTPRGATEDGARAGAAADERARPAPTTGADAGPATGKTEEREALRL